MKINIVHKDRSRLMRVISKLPFIPKNFMTTTWTTIGNTIYAPTYVNKDLRDCAVHFEATLRHEKVHVRQYSRYTIPGFLFIYLLLPVPIFLAYGRWRFEREAYLENLKRHSDPLKKEKMIERIVNTLWNDYAWCWPKRWMRAWFKKNS